jgi:hypothetical protein
LKNEPGVGSVGGTQILRYGHLEAGVESKLVKVDAALLRGIVGIGGGVALKE